MSYSDSQRKDWIIPQKYDLINNFQTTNKTIRSFKKKKKIIFPNTKTHSMISDESDKAVSDLMAHIQLDSS